MDPWKWADRDAADIAAYISAEVEIDHVEIWINVPYGFGDPRDPCPPFVGAVVYSDGRSGLSAKAEDIMTEIIATTSKLSAHRKIEGVARFQKLLREEMCSAFAQSQPNRGSGIGLPFDKEELAQEDN